MPSISSISSTQASQQIALQQQLQLVRQAALDAAAKALNLDPSALQGQLQSGKSIKDISAAEGVDFSTVQSAITTAIKPQLDQAVSTGQLSSSQATNALSRLTSGDAPRRAHHHHGGGGARGADAATGGVVDAAAQALKMDPTQLVSQLQAGKSLQDLANTQGVDFTRVQQAMSTASNGAAYSGSGSVTSASGTGALVNAAA